METKKCSVCKIEQPIIEYRKDKSRKDNIHTTCNSCNKQIQKNWYNNNREKAINNSLKNYTKNKNIINSKRRQQRIDNPEKIRLSARLKYDPIKSKINSWKQAGIKNMTYEKYLIMQQEQNNCCAICGVHRTFFKRELDVDHNHETGEVRGLLCTPCNSGIGKLKDSINMLEKAIKYLTKYE
jgi:hypothetical protein